MNHVAIDLGGGESQICVRGSDGAILEERKVPTRHIRRWLQRAPQSRVIVETCTEAFAVADAAKELGHEVRVVPATLVRALGVGARGVKTDRRDAQVLSETSCRIDLPTVHVPSQGSRDHKTACGMRDGLVAARTQLINTVRGWMRSQAERVTSTSDTFPRRVREWAAGAPKVKKVRGKKALAAAVETIPPSATPPRPPLPAYVEWQLEAIERLTEQIAKADVLLKEIALENPISQRLMSIPGVGPVTSIRFVAALDDISRFPNAHLVESYLGLVPGEDSSSSRQRRTQITKAGAPQLRSALIQAAWTIRRTRPNDPMARWCFEVEKRRGKLVAAVALARKLAGIMYAIWRDGTIYKPSMGATTTSIEDAARSQALIDALRSSMPT